MQKIIFKYNSDRYKLTYIGVVLNTLSQHNARVLTYCLGECVEVDRGGVGVTIVHPTHMSAVCLEGDGKSRGLPRCWL